MYRLDMYSVASLLQKDPVQEQTFVTFKLFFVGLLFSSPLERDRVCVGGVFSLKDLSTMTVKQKTAVCLVPVTHC